MNTSTEFRLIVGFLSLLCIFFAGWLASEHYHDPSSIAVMARPQARQADGSLIAAVATSAPVAAQIVPKGSKVDETFVAKIAPEVPVVADQPGTVLPADAAHPAETVTSGLIDTCDQVLMCPSVTVDGTIAHTLTGQPELILSTPGGQVQTATLDAGPVLAVPKAHPWAFGLSYGSGGFGLTGSRTFSDLPLILGLDVYRDDKTGLEGRVGVQWRF